MHESRVEPRDPREGTSQRWPERPKMVFTVDANLDTSCNKNVMGNRAYGTRCNFSHDTGSGGLSPAETVLASNFIKDCREKAATLKVEEAEERAKRSSLPPRVIVPSNPVSVVAEEASSPKSPTYSEDEND